ncbi:MAG: hypothetical protein GC155_14315 [Alphaproteobacteria bacterium]|nr:hypothetical protein [Alphaproteobacteria bacterium]
MVKADQPTILFRLTVHGPVAGATYSLQGKDGVVVDTRKSTGRAMVFDVPVRIAANADGKFRVLGDYVRTEGRTRRFFYIASGEQAGDAKACGGRRAKIDFPVITHQLATLAAKGGLVMEAGMAGAAKDGGPTAATVKLVPGWKIATAK